MIIIKYLRIAASLPVFNDLVNESLNSTLIITLYFNSLKDGNLSKLFNGQIITLSFKISRISFANLICWLIEQWFSNEISIG